MDAAGNESAPSSALAVTVDTAAPAAPAAPDLQAASDTGIPTNDVTADTTPAFDVAVPADLYFRLYRDGVLASEAPILGDDGGIYKAGTSEELPPQPAGTFSYRARLVDVAGNQSGQSAALQVQITGLSPVAWHEYEDGVFITLYDTDASNGLSSPNIAWDLSQLQKGVTDVLVDPGKSGDGIVESVKLYGDGTNTADLGIVVEHNVGLRQFSDERTGTPPVALLASEGYIGSIKLKHGILGANLNEFTTEGGWVFEPDVDGDGDASDLTAIYSGDWVNTIELVGDTSGDIVTAGTSDKGVSLGSFTVKSSGFHGDLVAPWAVSSITLGGDLNSSIRIGGALGSLSIAGGVSGSADIHASSLSSLTVTGGDIAGDLDVTGNIQSIQVKGGKSGGGSIATGAQIHAGGLIGKVNVTGGIAGASIRAGGQLQSLSVGASMFNTSIYGDTLGKITVKGLISESDTDGDADVVQAYRGTFWIQDLSWKGSITALNPHLFGTEKAWVGP